MTTLSLPLSPSYHEKKDMGYEKRNKGHAKESMKIKTKSWTHEGPRKKRARKKDSPYPRKRIKERRFMKRSSYTIHQKYPHTYTS
jgi:hypothetical protein